MLRVVVLLPVVAVAATSALAQPSAVPPAPAASVNESAVSERVRREAGNPLRLILEASRIRRAPAEAETPPARRPVAGAPSGPVAAPTPPAPAAVAPAAALAAVPSPAPAAPEPVLRTLAAPAETGGAIGRIVRDESLAPVSPVAPLALPAVPDRGPAAAPVVAAAPPPQQPGAAAPAAVATSAPPRLLTRVDPDIPSGVMRRLGFPSELQVDVTIQPDGSVRDVRMVSPAQRAAEPYVVEAMAQWRFERVAAPRLQRFSLVFAN